MANVVWSPQARAELKEILKFIARKDHRILTAAKIENEIRQKLIIYAENPEIGTRYPELPNDVLTCVYKRWAILYLPIENGIQVLNVIDSARDFKKLFGGK